MQGQSQASISQALLTVIAPALNKVAETKAQKAVIMVIPDASGQPISIAVQFAGGRHGCGDEGTGVWAFTEGVYGNERFDRAEANADDLVEPILTYLSGRLKDASVVSAVASFHPYPGYEAIDSVIASGTKA